MFITIGEVHQYLSYPCVPVYDCWLVCRLHRKYCQVQGPPVAHQLFVQVVQAQGLAFPSEDLWVAARPGFYLYFS